jgi:hypothetical protein
VAACGGNGAGEQRKGASSPLLFSGGWLQPGTAEAGGLTGDGMLTCSPSLFICLEGDMVSRAVPVRGGEKQGRWKRGGASCPLLVSGAWLQPGTAGDRGRSPNPRSCFCCRGAKSAIAPSSCRRDHAHFYWYFCSYFFCVVCGGGRIDAGALDV